MYALGFGIVPLVTASFSEEFGRQALYFWSGVGFLLMYIMIALWVPPPPSNTLEILPIYLLNGYDPEPKTFKPLLSLDSSRVHLVPLLRPWSVAQSPISGHLQSECETFPFFSPLPFRAGVAQFLLFIRGFLDAVFLCLSSLLLLWQATESVL